MQTLDFHLQYRSYPNQVLYCKFFEHAQEEEEEEERKVRNSNEVKKIEAEIKSYRM